MTGGTAAGASERVVPSDRFADFPQRFEAAYGEHCGWCEEVAARSASLRRLQNSLPSATHGT